MVRETGSWRDVSRHLTREFQLPIGAFREHHDHQILKCDHPDAKLDQLSVVQVGDIRTVN